MNRSEWLTDELIQAAFKRRAGRAAPGDLRETILTLSAASSQRSPWRLRLRSTMSTLALHPASLRGVAVAAAIGVIAVGAVFFVTRPDRPAVGGPSPTPNATVGPSSPASPSAGPSAAVVTPRAAAWTPTGKMITPRNGHTAVPLLDGRVLVVGGCCDNAGELHKSAELYDPGTGTWASTGAPRSVYSATLLADGKVLVAGGADLLTSAELYDPVSGTWSATGSMVAAFDSRMATRLLDGKVLVTGGLGDTSALAPAELYDPISGTWTATGATSIVSDTATLLPDGKVLVTGLIGTELARGILGIPSSELYDPISGTWSATGNMITPRVGHTATLLPDGKVLVAGGEVPVFPVEGAISNPLASAELYDPASGTWSATASMLAIRGGRTATLLTDGRVLVTGDRALGGFLRELASAELYDPASGTWSATASMLTIHAGYTATLLPDGKVLVAGACDSPQCVPPVGAAFAELYDPGSGN
jgi:hypothetical protein